MPPIDVAPLQGDEFAGSETRPQATEEPRIPVRRVRTGRLEQMHHIRPRHGINAHSIAGLPRESRDRPLHIHEALADDEIDRIQDLRFDAPLAAEFDAVKLAIALTVELVDEFPGCGCRALRAARCRRRRIGRRSTPDVRRHGVPGSAEYPADTKERAPAPVEAKRLRNDHRTNDRVHHETDARVGSPART
jgi:hypothetical protein